MLFQKSFQPQICFQILRRAINLIRNTHTEEKIKVAGIDINIVKTGSGPRNVLLLPGALGSAWTDFKPQIEKLPQLLPNHTIIAWDPPGYGKSIPPKRQFGLDFYQNDAKIAVELMRALERPKFSALGWSDGGRTAHIIAGRFGEKLEKLVIWGANAYITQKEVGIIQSTRDVKNLSARMREPMEKVYGPERLAELWAEWSDAYVEFAKFRQGDFCRGEVDNNRVPTFILHGKKDPFLAAEHIPYLREHIKHAKYYEFPEGKHNIHLRYEDEFNQLVAEFLLEK